MAVLAICDRGYCLKKLNKLFKEQIRERYLSIRLIFLLVNLMIMELNLYVVML